MPILYIKIYVALSQDANQAYEYSLHAYIPCISVPIGKNEAQLIQITCMIL